MIFLPVAVEVEILTSVTFVLTIIVLIPQLLLNIKLQSTEGLSAPMMILFLIGALAPAVYYIFTNQPIELTASWYSFSVVDMLILCQFSYYKPVFVKRTTLWNRRIHFVIQFILLSLVSASGSAILYYVFEYSDTVGADWVVQVLGYLLPIIFTIAGYVFQLVLIMQSKSSEGISPGFILIDIVGCSVAIASISLNKFNGAAIAPFATIIFCQIIMAICYYIIYPPPTPVEKEMQSDDSVYEPDINSIVD